MEDQSHTSNKKPGTRDPSPSTDGRRTGPEFSVCPRCGSSFHCSKSGKCWCYEVLIPLDKLEEIESLYDTCLCPTCLKEFSGPPRQVDGKYSRNSFVYVRKARP